MTTINERVAHIIDTACYGSKSAFARRINITPAHAAALYKMGRVPSDRTISNICREFRVREEWLRTGEGKMEKEEE